MQHPFASPKRMWSLAPADIEPEELRVAARLPAALEPRPRGVKVQIKEGAVGDKPGARHALVLEPANEPAEARMLAADARPEFRTWIYRLAAAGVARIRQVRERAEKSRGRGGSITAEAEACQRGSVAGMSLPATVFLRTSTKAGYLVLIQDLDVNAVFSPVEMSRDVPPCP